MKSDAFFVKGQSHDICQDYAIVKDNKMAISDGCSLINKDGICSKHPNSDIAARLICLAAIDESQLLSLNYLQKPFKGISLDATLTYVELAEDGSDASITRIGDGVIYLEIGDTRHLITVKYDPNTPEYISYALNLDKKKMYWSNPPSIIQIDYTFDKNWVQTNLPIHTILTKTGPDLSKIIDGDIKSISIFSDGILDIQGPNGRLDVVDAVRALVTFKRTNKEFVLARMKSQLRDWAREDIYPNDDLSMATLILE